MPGERLVRSIQESVRFPFKQSMESYLMKNFTIKAVAVAVGVICGGVAHAGAITAPLANAETRYAVEALIATTDIVLPTIVYTMGVSRTPAQDFTVIITPSAGATFTGASCLAALPVAAGGGGAATVSQKRSSATECAYEVDVTAAFTTATTLTFANLVFDTHNLATAGSTAGIVLALRDLGETAFIDNSGTLSRNVALSGNALTLTAIADIATRADVNDELGPLFGFVTVGDDADAVARAAFVIGNNSGLVPFKRPDGIANWDFTVDGTAIGVTIPGNFQGLLAAGFTAVTSAGGPVPVVTATAGGANASFTLLPANIAAVLTNTTVTTTFTSARTASLGTSRTFGVSAVADVVTGADSLLSGNPAWWVWGANASQLMTPYFTTNSLFLSRFYLLSNSTGPVTYSADCFSETGNAITYQAGRTGTLASNTLTAINASSICTFAGNTRGAIIFTVNAPINQVKGSYQYIDPVSLNGIVTPLTRPYNQANTTE